MMASPSARSWRTRANRAAVSRDDRDVVGSSMTRMRELAMIARAISTSCLSAMDSKLTRGGGLEPAPGRPRPAAHGRQADEGRGLEAGAEPFENRPAGILHGAAVHHRAGLVLPPEKHVLGYREIGREGKLLVDDGDAVMPGGERAVDRQGP